MITPKLSGMDVNVEGDLNNFRGGDGIQVFEDTKYDYAADLSTPTTPLIDPQTGKTVVIRAFNFQMNPEFFKGMPVDNQELFNHHARQIQTVLWADGLRPLDEVPPRVIINVKNGLYHIFVPCEARLSTVFADKPRNLSAQITNQNDTSGH